LHFIENEAAAFEITTWLIYRVFPSERTLCRSLARFLRYQNLSVREFDASHQWSTRMALLIRTCVVLMAAALGSIVAAAPTLAQGAPQCVVSGSAPAGWGFNSIGYIEIASGGSCMFSVSITGEILNSSVSQNPAHGTLQQLDVSSFIYTSEAGYRGRDAFSVQATGKSETSSGTSVFTINATIQ
jgi:hypothetical protein